MSFLQAWNGDPCTNCAKANSRRAGHPNRIETKSATVKLAAPTTPENIKSSSQPASEGSTTPATAFTSLAWVIVALTFICTLIATFAIAADGDTFLAMMMFIGGCFSAVLLGLLTEISANIAKLVNSSR